MTGGKGGNIPAPKLTRGVSTRGNRPAGSPKNPLPGTPTRGSSPKNDKSDTQRVLDRLDSIEKRLEAIIDEAIISQEFSSSQLKAQITENEKKGLVQDEQIGALKEATSGATVQLKVHGLRLTEIENKIERIEKRMNTLIIDGVQEKDGEVTASIVDDLCKDLQIRINASSCVAIFRRGKVGDNREDGGARPQRPGADGVRARPRPIVVIFPTANEKAEIL